MPGVQLSVHTFVLCMIHDILDFFHDVTSLNMMIRKFCYQAVVVVVAVAVAGKAKKKEENQVNKYSFTYRYQCHPQGH